MSYGRRSSGTQTAVSSPPRGRFVFSRAPGFRDERGICHPSRMKLELREQRIAFEELLDGVQGGRARERLEQAIRETVVSN